MRFRLIIHLLAAFLLLPGPAAAADAAEQDFADALALYDEGRFEEVLTAARALNTADGFALASRTGLVLIRYFIAPKERPAAIAAALADARRALELNPGHLEGNLQAAISIGYRGKQKRSIADAHAGRHYIDTALLHHPGNAWALGALGGWNGEVVMEAGRFFAGALFGAKRKKAVQNFRAALEAQPGNIGIRTSFAITLLRFNRQRFEAEARALLVGNAALVGRNALDEILLRQSQELLQALQEGRGDDLEALLERATTVADH